MLTAPPPRTCVRARSVDHNGSFNKYDLYVAADAWSMRRCTATALYFGRTIACCGRFPRTVTKMACVPIGRTKGPYGGHIRYISHAGPSLRYTASVHAKWCCNWPEQVQLFGNHRPAFRFTSLENNSPTLMHTSDSTKGHV